MNAAKWDAEVWVGGMDDLTGWCERITEEVGYISRAIDDNGGLVLAEPEKFWSITVSGEGELTADRVIAWRAGRYQLHPCTYGRDVSDGEVVSSDASESEVLEAARRAVVAHHGRMHGDNPRIRITFEMIRIADRLLAESRLWTTAPVRRSA